jgi:hypothetical protein
LHVNGPLPRLIRSRCAGTTGEEADMAKKKDKKKDKKGKKKSKK